MIYRVLRCGVFKHERVTLAGAIRIVHVLSNELVRTDSATGNGMLGTQDFLLKGRATVQANRIEREPNVFAVQERLDMIDKNVDLFTGRNSGIGAKPSQCFRNRGSRLR